MSTVDNETRFNDLKAHFGSGNSADQLTLEEFVALPDTIAEDLIKRIAETNIKFAGEISKIRARAKQAPPASKYKY
jgi:hypothetical protein